MKYEAKENPYYNHILDNVPKALSFIETVLQISPVKSFVLPQIFFSGERRQQSFGVYHVQNVLREIERLRKNFSDVALEADSLAISLLQETEQFLRNKGDWQLWQQVRAMAKALQATRCSSPLVLRTLALHGKCQRLLISQPVQAVFSSDNKITFYEENIKSIAGKQQLTMEEYLPVILVHELTHALHYAYVMEQQRAAYKTDAEQYLEALAYWSGEGYIKGQVRTVKEALARYVQYRWCSERHFALAQVMEQEHRDAGLIYPNWPYAGAASLLRKPVKESGLLAQELWRASAVDWHGAYDCL